MHTALSALLFALLPVLWLCSTLFIPQHNPLGVTVPSAHQNDPVIRTGWLRFHIANFVIAVVFAAITVACFYTRTESEASDVEYILWMVQAYSIFFTWWWAGRVIRKKKTEQNWVSDAHVEVAGSLTPGTSANAIPQVSMQWTPYVCSYLLTGITALLLWLRWGDIPPMVSIDNSYGTHELAAKTVWTVFDDVFFALGLVTACTIWAVFNHLKRGQYRTAMSPSARRRAQLLSESQQQSIGWLTICFTLCLNLLSITVFPTFANSGKTLYILNVAIIVGVVVALSIHHTKTARSLPIEPDGADSRDQDSHYAMGMFYANKDDPAMFVDHLNGNRLVLNWANTKGVLLAVGTSIMCVLLITLPIVLTYVHS